MNMKAHVIKGAIHAQDIDMPKPTKKKAKKKTSFGQFDMGRGSQAAKSKHKMSSDPRTLGGKRLTKKQKQRINRANRGS